MENSRISSIETFRVIAVFAVICLHSLPFGGMPDKEGIFFLINNSCRFAVPFFFLTSGYFFGKSLEKGRAPMELLSRYCKRLFLLFVSWSVIYGLLAKSLIRGVFAQGIWKGYLLPLIQQPWVTFQWALGNPMQALLGGTAPHLWFFTSLMISLTLLVLFMAHRGEKLLMALSLLLCMLSLLMMPYSSTPVGIRVHLPFDIQHSPMVSTFFVVMGWWFSTRNVPTPLLSLLIVAVGYIWQLSEAFLIWRIIGISPVFCFLAGTAPFAIGVFLLALAYPGIGKGTVLARIGCLTLGIYASHLLFVREIRISPSFIDPVLWQILCPLAVFFLAMTFVIALRRFRWTRFLVT